MQDLRCHRKHIVVRPTPATLRVMGVALPLLRDHVAHHLTLPTSERHRYGWYVEQVVNAYEDIVAFATAHGWADLVDRWFDRVEVFDDQLALWSRLRIEAGLPDDAPLPTPALAGALEGRVLRVVTPELYARVQPRYGAAPDAFRRLLGHELAHRLHIAVLDGDEAAMGPRWFFEGFAIVASGDLADLATADAHDVTEHMRAAGDGAYARYVAALRFWLTHLPLRDLVARAGEPEFERWLAERLEPPQPPR